MFLGVSRAMIVSVLMVLLQSTAQGDQMIIESPISTEVLKGTDATLRCTVQDQVQHLLTLSTFNLLCFRLVRYNGQKMALDWAPSDRCLSLNVIK